MASTLEFLKTSLHYLSMGSHGGTANANLAPNQRLMPLTTEVADDDHLVVGGCKLSELVQQFGSPLYILDEVTLRTACREYREAMTDSYPGESLVVYASKAWNCLAVCAIAHSEGLGIDVVSGGELFTATQAGVPADRIYFHGNNKSTAELELAIATGCRIVVDNWHELQLLTHLLDQQPAPEAVKAPILLRLTPGIECHTHEYIQTGHLDSKFGFDPDQIEAVLQYVSEQPALRCIGLHAHIGSQIFEVQPHIDLADVMVQWLKRAADYQLPIAELDIGGGLGICYTEADDPPSIQQWVQTVAEAVIAACQRHGVPLPRLLCEPGRSLIGSACVTAYTVGSQKEVPGSRTYVAVDGGMSDNPRPITYQAAHRAIVANRLSAPLTVLTTLAGKHCESGDILIQDAWLPQLATGDIIVIPATGAYNYSMASNYNRVPRPAAILVRHGESHIIIQRETLQDLIRQDHLPAAIASENTLAT